MVESTQKMILSNGRFSGTSRADLAAAFDAFAASPAEQPLVIHFHGGLVNESEAERIAERLLSVYRAAGAYPFFVIWQSGLVETLKNNWQEIVDEDVIPALVEPVLRFLIGKLEQEPGQRGATLDIPTRLEVGDEISKRQVSGVEPFSERDVVTTGLDPDLAPQEEEQFKALLSHDTRFLDVASRIGREDGPRLNAVIEAEIERARGEADLEAKGLISSAALIAAGVRILKRALKRFATGRDHGMYTTVIEEVVRELKGDLIGGIVWKHMKKDTAGSFQDVAETYGGTALLEEFARVWQAGRRPRFVLVGHSAGAVYICHLLEKAAAILPADIRFEVLFLAPACSFKLLDHALLVAGDRVAGFRSFGMHDAIEKQDAVLPPLYARSLLYFVSGLVEETVDLPLVGMERYHGEVTPFDATAFPEIKRVRDRMSVFPAPWIWSESAVGDGKGTLARKHGDFDDDATTLESVAYFIARGVG